MVTKPVRVLVFRPGSPSQDGAIDPSLEAMRELVGGNLGGLRIAPTIYLHFDDDGRLIGKAPCVFVDGLGDVVVGTCFAVGVDAQGEARSLTEEEVTTIRQIVTPVSFVAPGRFQA